MIHVFLLMFYLGTGDDRKLMSADMYFRDINECNYFAEKLAKRYGNYQYIEYMDARDRATVYCIPKYVDKGSGVKIYDWSWWSN